MVYKWKYKICGVFINGELNGKFDMWHKNGNKFLSINVKKGKTDGESEIKLWNKNGKQIGYKKSNELQAIEKIISNINK